MQTKICTTCGIKKEISEFYKQKSGKFGVNSTCKLCWLLWQRKYCKENQEIIRDYQYKKRYGITQEEYNKLFKLQNGICAICGKEETSLDNLRKTIKLLAVDHNHKTGKVRELLCDKCNRAIGLFNDNINLLESALNYLKKHDC